MLGKDAPTPFSPGYNRTRILDAAGLQIPESAWVAPPADADPATAAG